MILPPGPADASRRRVFPGGRCLLLCLALLSAGCVDAAEYPVRPRPECPEAPGGAQSRRLRVAPACQGPLLGARAAPRRHAGRQQWRMRACQAQARQRELSGAARADFVRHCLHRGR